MPLFDAYFILDFSARSAPSPVKPTADAIWLAVGRAGQPTTTTYHRTRADAFDRLTESLTGEVRRGHRVLLGVDFALGYPAGFAELAGLGDGEKRPPWSTTWNFLYAATDDSPRNANNRFDVAKTLNRRVRKNLSLQVPDPTPSPKKKQAAGKRGANTSGGPFWACPAGVADNDLTAKRPLDFPYNQAHGLPRRRLVEQRVPTAHEVWKLFTTGSVGSQSLLGIARLEQLRQHPQLQSHVHVWPFDTGFSPEASREAGVCVVEVYPSLINDQADRLLAQRSDVTIKDQAQVLALADYFATADQRGNLRKMLEKPAGLSQAQARRCVDEEGWIPGVE